MSQTIRVQLDMDDPDFKEVSFEEAKNLVAESNARGIIVLDKETRRVVREITPEVKEIIIVHVVNGG